MIGFSEERPKPPETEVLPRATGEPRDTALVPNPWDQIVGNPEGTPIAVWLARRQPWPGFPNAC